MKFPTPPPLVQKPKRPNPYLRLEKYRQGPLRIVLLSALTLGGLLFCVGLLLLVIVFWRIFVRLGYPQLLSAGFLFLFFLAGFSLGTWSGKLVARDLMRKQPPEL